MFNYKEGLDTTPMDVIKTQQGDIESIKSQLSKITITQESVKELQDSADTLTDQINTLQTNLPDPQVKKYAQE
jgi:hypothetical protein